MDEFAECASDEPRLRDVTDDSRRQTDEHDQQVCRRQIHDEQIRHCPHLRVLPDDDTDQRVAGQSADEDGRVQNNDDPFERRREDVLAQFIDVVFVADAVVVGAVGRRRPEVARRLGRQRRRHLPACSTVQQLQPDYATLALITGNAAARWRQSRLCISADRATVLCPSYLRLTPMPRDTVAVNHQRKLRSRCIRMAQ